MKVSEFEDKVWEVEGIRIVIRADENTEVKDYDFTNAANESWRIGELGEKRISKCLGDMPYVVIQGNGESPHGRTILRTIRHGYGNK